MSKPEVFILCVEHAKYENIFEQACLSFNALLAEFGQIMFQENIFEQACLSFNALLDEFGQIMFQDNTFYQA